MVLRTAYLPKSIDLKLHQVGVYAAHSSKSEALGDLVCSGLEAMREGSVEISRCTEPAGDETVVLRSVWFTPEIDNELQRRAFRRSQRRGQLVINCLAGMGLLKPMTGNQRLSLSEQQVQTTIDESESGFEV